MAQTLAAEILFHQYVGKTILHYCDTRISEVEGKSQFQFIKS